MKDKLLLTTFPFAKQGCMYDYSYRFLCPSGSILYRWGAIVSYEDTKAEYLALDR